MQQEGEPGRQKISQYTRYLTIFICLVQGGLLAVALETACSLIQDLILQRLAWMATPWSYCNCSFTPLFLFNAIIFLTTGSIILMWLGEQITQRGIGNGISLLITVESWRPSQSPF